MLANPVPLHQSLLWQVMARRARLTLACELLSRVDLVAAMVLPAYPPRPCNQKLVSGVALRLATVHTERDCFGYVPESTSLHL